MGLVRYDSLYVAIDTLAMPDERNIRVERTTARPQTGRLFDVFDPERRYLGEVRLPFALSLGPVPIIRSGVLHGVIRDELEVPYVVRARIVKP